MTGKEHDFLDKVLRVRDAFINEFGDEKSYGEMMMLLVIFTFSMIAATKRIPIDLSLDEKIIRFCADLMSHANEFKKHGFEKNNRH